MVDDNDSVKSRLFKTGAALFAEKGFDRVTVREICQSAETSANMIHHYYGSKEGLFEAIVDSFTENVFTFPLRILEKEVHSREEFISRFEMFFEETLTALIEHRTLLHVISRHEVEVSPLAHLMQKFTSFLETSKKNGFVQSEIEPELVSGCLMERLSTQVLYAHQIAKYSNSDIIQNDQYRKNWIRANLNLFLYGFVGK